MPGLPSWPPAHHLSQAAQRDVPNQGVQAILAPLTPSWTLEGVDSADQEAKRRALRTLWPSPIEAARTDQRTSALGKKRGFSQ